GEHGASGIAVANDTVYWGTSSPNALAFALQVGNVPVTRIPVGGPVDGVAVDPQGVAYFLVGAQTLCRLDVGSTQPQTIYDAGAPFGVSDIAVDDAWIYWSEHDRGRIMRMPR